MPQASGRAGSERSIAFERALALLGTGVLSVEGQLPWSSNVTYLASVSDGELSLPAVYKPARGERPLWDFPLGTLCQREVAAFVVSEALGWRLVPPTVLRDGPLGRGAVQAFIPHDPDAHYLALDAPDPLTSRRIAAFDVVVNNADRKAGHVLLAADGSLWAIDHGVSFHVEPKLRTVIWEFSGEEVPPEIRGDLRRFLAMLDDAAGPVATALASLLAADEVSAIRDRASALSDAGRFPGADPHRRSVPWPPV